MVIDKSECECDQNGSKLLNGFNGLLGMWLPLLFQTTGYWTLLRLLKAQTWLLAVD